MNRPVTQYRKSSGQLRLPGLILGLILIAACGCGEKGGEKKAGPPPPAVLVAKVEQKTVPIYVEYVARTEARETVEIRARVEGFLEKISFKEGSTVKAGQLLFLIDQRPYKAALQDARGQLAQAQAALGKAIKDVERLKPLVAADAAPKQDLDKAEAEAEYNRASIEKGRAAVAKAELDLKFTEIRAPITGTIGREEVSVGNLVTKDKTLLTTLSSWDPMRAVFSLSESDYLSLIKKYPEGKQKASNGADEPFELILADNSIYPYKGKVSFVDRALDLTTGTLKVYVNFPNPDKLLRPGLFGRIRVSLEERPDALLAPQKAVTEQQGVTVVYVVLPDNKVALRTVTLGERYQNLVVVKEGIKAGERLVVEGLQKVRPGMVVNPADKPVTEEKKAG